MKSKITSFVVDFSGIDNADFSIIYSPTENGAKQYIEIPVYENDNKQGTEFKLASAIRATRLELESFIDNR